MTDHPRGAVGAALGGDAHSSPSSVRRVPAAANLLTVPRVEHLHVGNPIAHAVDMWHLGRWSVGVSLDWAW